MPKRPNPFGESSPLQFKTHVGKKEVDLGVNMEQNMQLVYDRTKSLLYEGSKKTVDCSACGDDQDWSSMDTREELRLLPGQMRINGDGQLHPISEVENMEETAEGKTNGSAEVDMEPETPVNHVNGDSAISKPKTPVKQLIIDNSGKLCSQIKGLNPDTTSSGCRICHSCNRPIHIVPRQCNFCDKATCNNCLLQCCGCHGLFCQFCCVLNYDDCMERPFCLQCST